MALSATSMLMQLMVATTTTTCFASTGISLSDTKPGTLFTQLGLDEAVWDAVAEAVLALLVFGLASVAMRHYRGKTQKPLKQSKGKSMPSNKKTLANINQIAAGLTSDSTKAGAPWRLQKEQDDVPSAAKSKDSTRVVKETDVIAHAIRAGKAAKLPQLLDLSLQRSLAAASCQDSSCSKDDVASHLLLAGVRACAASRCFQEAIVAYDHMVDRIGEGSANLWSVLLYTAVEIEGSSTPLMKSTRASDRCGFFFTMLCKHAAPSCHDFVNIVRCYASRQNPAALQETLSGLQRSGFSVDVHTWNRALAACNNSEAVLELAEELVALDICEGGLDAVSYNTLMKYMARAGRVSRCFELRDEMLAKGLEPSEVTFGILLDTCVAHRQLDRAREVFGELASSGLQLNVVHCTSFMKVLISANRLDEAAAVLREMIVSPGVKPDLITYSTMVKAYADNGDSAAALKILAMMLEEGVKADEIIFNSVLTCCSTCFTKASTVMKTFEALLGHGMKPTTTTLSILLKALAASDAWDVSLQVLNDAPEKLGVEPEARLHAQLLQSMVKARHTQMVLPVFTAMTKAARRQRKEIDAAAVGRCLRSCVLAGELDQATQMWIVIEKDHIAVDFQVQKLYKTALAKKLLGRDARTKELVRN
jgi:pentatricopeptide repeat protein